MRRKRKQRIAGGYDRMPPYRKRNPRSIERPLVKEPATLAEALRRSLERQRLLREKGISDKININKDLDLVLGKFRSASEIWENSINSWLDNSKIPLDESIRKLETIRDDENNSDEDKIKNNLYEESAHVFLVISNGLENLQSLRKDFQKREMLKSYSNVKDVDNALKLTETAVAAFMKCRMLLRIDISSLLKLDTEVNNSEWCSRKLWKRNGYKDDKGIAFFKSRMVTAAIFLVDYLFAALLCDLVPDETRRRKGIPMIEEPEGKSDDVWLVLSRKLKFYSQAWGEDLDVVRMSTSLTCVIQRCGAEHIQLYRNICQNIEELYKNTTLKNDFSLRASILKRMSDSLWKMIPKDEEEKLKKEEDDKKNAWLKKLEDEEGLKKFLRGIYCNSIPGSIRLALDNSSVDALLFDWEREALKVMVEENEDFLKHLDRVYYPMYDPHCSHRGRLNPMGVAMRNGALNICTKAVATTEYSFKTLRVSCVSLVFLYLSTFFYIADVGTDFYALFKHSFNSDYVYTFLTILFICGPLLAEIINKIWWTYFEGNKNSTWSELFYPETVMVLPRSMKSIMFANKSRRTYSGDMRLFFSKLLYLRLKMDEDEYESKDFQWMKSPNLIQALCFSRMIQNEMYMFDWRMMECLNESSPQLLLQLYIVLQDLYLHETLDVSWSGIISLLGILSSVLSFSWTMHIYHYNMHYEGLSNKFGWKRRILDFLLHFLILSSRFLAVSLAMSTEPLYLFPLVGILYLVCLTFYLLRVNQYREFYQLLLKNRRMLLWPLYRLFTTPYLLRIWRIDYKYPASRLSACCIGIDNLDDIFFHVETMGMALYWSWRSPTMSPLEKLKWILPLVIITMELVILVWMWANNWLHKKTVNCPNESWSLQEFKRVANLEFEDLGSFSENKSKEWEQSTDC